MIIYEQRGTKYAQPNLDCPEVDLANIASAKTGANHKEARKDELAAARSCYDRLAKSGIDLSAYNSAESAADIEDLRRVLKLDKINLYGVSYSARLMLDVMRYFPNGIRSAVLESTLPPETNYDEVGVDNIVRTLNEMFSGCRTDANCAGAYPNLQREFYDVVERLNTKPLVVTKKDSETNASFDVQLTGNDFVTWIVDYLFSNEPAATVDAPSLIHHAHAGSYAEQFKRDGGPRLSRSTNSLGMRYSVWCGEEIPFENMTKIKRQGRKHPGLIGYEVMSLPDICSVWKVKRARAIANQSVKSDIPTLVLGAQYDAYTDPRWGRKVADRLKNGFFIEVPWAGHGPGFSVPCVRAMITDFIDEPNVQPKPDCVEKTRSEFKFLIKN